MRIKIHGLKIGRKYELSFLGGLGEIFVTIQHNNKVLLEEIDYTLDSNGKLVFSNKISKKEFKRWICNKMSGLGTINDNISGRLIYNYFEDGWIKTEQRYESDCPCCKFVKRGLDYFGEDCDIFVTTSSEQCVVFRYSDRPSDNRAIDIEQLTTSLSNRYDTIINDEEIMNNFK